MADKNRKSKRIFNIEKHTPHYFDIEKEDNVTPIAPTANADEKPVVVAPNGDNIMTEKKQKHPSQAVTTEHNDDEMHKGSSKKWLIIALVCIVGLCIAGYYFLGSNSPYTEHHTPSDNIAGISPDSKTPGNNANGSTNAETSTDSIEDDLSQLDRAGTTNNPENISNGTEPKVGTEYSEASNSESDVLDNNSESKASKDSTKKNAIESNNVNPNSTETANMSSNLSIEEKARLVWKGVYGNNPDRRRNLGEDYEAVQKRVNEMSRKINH